MKSDRTTLEHLSNEMARVTRRYAEYRRPAGDDPAVTPFRLLGIVANHAVIRRHASAPMIVALKDFDAWQLVDADGAPINAS